MVDLSKLSPQALRAAMRGGTANWGLSASITGARYAEPVPNSSRRRCKCGCGCGKRATHAGRVNGITLIMGCEFFVARWVKDAKSALKHRISKFPAEDPTHD